jgi:pimeloyl-ACP methyl ester carboxylesterase
VKILSKSKQPSDAHGLVTDLQGASRLAVATVSGIVDVVDSMHRNIRGLSPIVGAGQVGPTTGITGFVYRRIRGVTHTIGGGIDAALTRLARGSPQRYRSRNSAATRAALNGLCGDYLADKGNPLAIRMSLYSGDSAVSLDRDALSARFSQGEFVHTGRIVVMIHGLCMNDLQWATSDHDHRSPLATTQESTVLSLLYNSGRHVYENGLDLAAMLEVLYLNWPVPIIEVVFVCHSMGGLVARSAAMQAENGRMKWRSALKAIVFLGTPHLGAPLEQGAAFMLRLLSASPYAAPIASVGMARSAGIKDLRYGRVQKTNSLASAARIKPPDRVRCLLIAATVSAPFNKVGAETKRCRGDGLVPRGSALGLGVSALDQATFFNMNHFELLSSRAVCDKIISWLA